MAEIKVNVGKPRLSSGYIKA